MATTKRGHFTAHDNSDKRLLVRFSAAHAQDVEGVAARCGRDISDIIRDATIEYCMRYRERAANIVIMEAQAAELARQQPKKQAPSPQKTYEQERDAWPR